MTSEEARRILQASPAGSLPVVGGAGQPPSWQLVAVDDQGATLRGRDGHEEFWPTTSRAAATTGLEFAHFDLAWPSRAMDAHRP